jgi:hypothetical protein
MNSSEETDTKMRELLYKGMLKGYHAIKDNERVLSAYIGEERISDLLDTYSDILDQLDT